MKDIIINVIKGISDKNDHTLSRVLFFLNCVFALLIATNIIFPLRDIASKYLDTPFTQIVSDIALVVWYCSLFLFLIGTSVSIISCIVFIVLNKVENVRGQIKATDMAHRLFCTAHSAYVHIFSYITLTSFILFFIEPNELVPTVTSFLLRSVCNPLKLAAIIFASLCIIECSILLLIDIVIKWIFPDYYEYEDIYEKAR